MSLASSIQKHTLTIAAGSAETRSALTGGVTAAKCVPFFTKRHGVVETYSQQQDSVDVYVDTGTGEVVAKTFATGTTRTIIVEVSVGVFSAEANVYAGTFTIADLAASGTAAIGATVTTAKAFAMSSWTSEPATAINSHWAIRTTFSGSPTTSELTFSRGSTTGAIAGHWYVVEAVGSQFSVQTVTIAVDAGTLDGALDPEVIMAKTMVVGSYETTGVGDDPDDRPYAYLFDTTNVRLTRLNTSGIATATLFVVSFAGSESVQRGVLTQTTSTADQTITITTPVTVNDSIAWAPIGSVQNNGSTATSTGTTGHPDASLAMTFTGTGESDQLRCQRSVNLVGLTSWDYAWEVVEWDTGAAPASRRIFIIS